MCVSRTNDPCGFLCIFIMYAAVLYGDYVVLKWILFDVYESLLAILFHIGLFHALVVFVLRSHCQAAFRDPGFCVRRLSRRDSNRTRSTTNRKIADNDDNNVKNCHDNDHDYLNKFDLTSSSSSSSSSSITVISMDNDKNNNDDDDDDDDGDNDNNDRKDWTICMKCELWRPPRAHHCRICGRCVRRMDHHCPWINNCVGEQNQYDFQRFLLAVSLLSSYTIVLVLDTWLNTPAASRLQPAANTNIYLHNVRSLHLNIVFIESVIFGLFGFVMFVDQRSMNASDTTTLEKKRNKSAAGTGGVTSHWRHWRLLMLPCRLLTTKTQQLQLQSPSLSRRKNHKLSYSNYVV